MRSVYYRFVKAELATVDDFLPQGALGKPMLRPGNQRAWNEGLSVWDTFDSACQRAQILRFRPGSYVVELQLPDDHDLEIDGPSGWRGHHYTIYGADPAVLLIYAGMPIKMPGAP